MDDLIGAAELEFVVAFVNEYAGAPRVAAGKDAHGYPDLALLSEAAPIAGAVVAAPGSRMRLSALVELADRLHRVFFNAQTAPSEALRALNQLLLDSHITSHLSTRGVALVSDWQLLPVVGRKNIAARRLQAACALALHQWLSGNGSLERLGTCRARRCVDVYVDATQAVSRRYCSSTCANRTKVAAYRARRHLSDAR